MGSKKITYDRDMFIKLAPVRKKTAEKYCEDHPKDRYDDSDFDAVYYLDPDTEHHQVVGSGRWAETDTDRDRLIDDYNRSMYGE